MTAITGGTKTGPSPGIAELRANRRDSGEDRGTGAPTLPGCDGAMGVEGLAAALAVESLHDTARLMNEFRKGEELQQVDALHRQVAELHEKAGAVRMEGLVGGMATALGGAVTFASAFSGPTAAERAENEALKGESLRHPGDAAGRAYGAHDAVLQHEAAVASVMATSGQNIGQLGAQVAKGTAGAAQVLHDANATEAAAAAKFHEAAKDDYASLARDAKGIIDRVQQTLQQIRQDRDAALRSILRA